MEFLPKELCRKRISYLLALMAATWLAWPLPGLAAERMAPKITGTDWVNSKPLTAADLKGRVVLVEFWTYG